MESIMTPQTDELDDGTDTVMPPINLPVIRYLSGSGGAPFGGIWGLYDLHTLLPAPQTHIVLGTIGEVRADYAAIPATRKSRAMESYLIGLEGLAPGQAIVVAVSE